MKAPIGAIVSLYIDSLFEVSIGEFLQTPTGRLYQIVSIREQKKGQHIGRKHIKALVSEKAPRGSKVHPIYWYSRKKRR